METTERRTATAAETRKRKPLADRTNTTLSSTSSTAAAVCNKKKTHRLTDTISFVETRNTRSRKDNTSVDNTAESDADCHISIDVFQIVSSSPSTPLSLLAEPLNQKKETHRLINTISVVETRNTKRRRGAYNTTIGRAVDNAGAANDCGNKENVPADANRHIGIDIFQGLSSPSTPASRQPLSPLAEPLTVYARRQTAKKKGKEKVIDEAFTCPIPVTRKRNESNKTSFTKTSRCLTEHPKKRRVKEHEVSNDYFQQQRAYFAEIDKCELPEEEVSESELSDR